jgi:transposase
MAIPVALRADFKASHLGGLARKTKDGPQARRLLAVAAIYDGATRTEAAKIGGVGLQIIRDWVMRFNASGAAGLLDGKSPGQPSKLNDVQRQAIVRMIESGPIPAIHGVVRWRLIDLSQWRATQLVLSPLAPECDGFECCNAANSCCIVFHGTRQHSGASMPIRVR